MRKTLLISFQPLAVVLFLSLAFTSKTLGQSEGSQPQPFSGRDSVVAYSKDFAKRFALPEPEPGMELSGPLQALEFRVEPSRYSAVPGANLCLLSVYVDASVPLHFPTEGPSGSETVGLAQRHFFVHPNKGREHWLRLALEDRRHFGSIQSRYNNNAAVATMDFSWSPQRGSLESVEHREFHRELFPSLAYVQLNLGCPFPRWLGVPRQIHLWLKRLGGKDYSRIVRMDPVDFEKFDIPALFVEKMSRMELAKRETRPPSITPQGQAADRVAPEK